MLAVLGALILLLGLSSCRGLIEHRNVLITLILLLLWFLDRATLATPLVRGAAATFFSKLVLAVLPHRRLGQRDKALEACF